MAFAPFGIEFGAPPPDSLQQVDDFFSEGEAPSPHRDFSRYICVSGAEGVGRVFASSDSITYDHDGSNARGTFDRIVRQLASKYGDPLLCDILLDDALFNEDHDWANSITHGERTYLAMWSPDGESLPPELEEIMLSISPHPDGGLKLMLCYSGFNYADIEAEIEDASADVL